MKIRNITTAVALTLATAAMAGDTGQAKPQVDRSPKAQNAEELFARYDTNKDGQVTPEEFRGGKTLFTAYDADKNGVLTIEEIKAARQHTNRPNFRSLDTDKDGYVTRREWQGTQEEFDAVDVDNDGVWSRADLAIEKQRTQAQGMLDRFDANKDGVLSYDEWATAQRDESSFRRQDLNRDAKLDVDELATPVREQ